MNQPEQLLFRSIVERTSDLVSVVSRDGTIRYASPSFGRVLGLDPATITGQPVSGIIHPEDVSKLLDNANGRRELDHGHRLELRLLDSDGGTRLIEAVVDDLSSDPEVDGLVLHGRDVTERRQLTDELARQAEHDPLTGLPNRVKLTRRLEMALHNALLDDTTVAVLFIDLDRFKQVNDTLGHAVGDMLLERIARRLWSCLRPTDLLARVGGDEFTVVLRGLHNTEEAGAIGRRLLEALRVPFEVDGYEFLVTASIGISIFREDGTDAATLLRNADRAMYRAKNTGKDDVRFFTAEMGDRAFERLNLESSLRHALEQNEFRLFFQPESDLNGALRGLEVLLTWDHPKLGRIKPSQFIPIAEETGMIVAIGAWVLEEACRQARAMERGGQEPLKLAVNVSALQFGRSDFVQSVASALRRTGLPAKLLELELTESLVMRDAIAATRRMAELRSLGVGILIDDFGTGYSSLSYLRKLPASALKIDRSFLEEMLQPGGTLPLVQTIVSLAHSMGLETIAEGVETKEQFSVLRSSGCDFMQGRLFGESVTSDDIDSLLKRRANLLADA